MTSSRNNKEDYFLRKTGWKTKSSRTKTAVNGLFGGIILKVGMKRWREKAKNRQDLASILR